MPPQQTQKFSETDMAAFAFELVSPEKLVFSGEVEQVVLPGTEGDFSVLKNHAPVISALRPGLVTIKDEKGATTSLFVRGGFADVSSNGLIVLAERAIPVSDIKGSDFDVETKLAADELKAAQTDESKQIAAERLSQIEALRSAIIQ